MFPTGYWSRRYWTGRYWPPTDVVVELPPTVPLESVLVPGNLVAILSLDSRLGAILTGSGIVSARITSEDAAWLAEELPPSATLVRGDLSVVLGPDALAVQMPVLYVSSEIVSELLLASRLENEAVVSVVSREEQSVTLNAE